MNGQLTHLKEVTSRNAQFITNKQEIVTGCFIP